MACRPCYTSSSTSRDQGSCSPLFLSPTVCFEEGSPRMEDSPFLLLAPKRSSSRVSLFPGVFCSDHRYAGGDYISYHATAQLRLRQEGDAPGRRQHDAGNATGELSNNRTQCRVPIMGRRVKMTKGFAACMCSRCCAHVVFRPSLETTQGECCCRVTLSYVGDAKLDRKNTRLQCESWRH